MLPTDHKYCGWHVEKNEVSGHRKRMKSKTSSGTRCGLLLGLSSSFWNKRSLSCTGKTLQAVSHCFTASCFCSNWGMKNCFSGQNHRAVFDQCLLFVLFFCRCQRRQKCDKNWSHAERKNRGKQRSLEIFHTLALYFYLNIKPQI